MTTNLTRYDRSTFFDVLSKNRQQNTCARSHPNDFRRSHHRSDSEARCLVLLNDVITIAEHFVYCWCYIYFTNYFEAGNIKKKIKKGFRVFKLSGFEHKLFKVFKLKFQIFFCLEPILCLRPTKNSLFRITAQDDRRVVQWDPHVVV